MTDNSRQNEQEWNRRYELLHHLRTDRLDNVPTRLLREPALDTRPRLGLVETYPEGVWLVFLKQISVMRLLRTASMFLIGFLGVLVSLSSLLEANLAAVWTLPVDLVESTPAFFASNPWLEALFQQLLMPAGWVLASGVAAVLTHLLKGWLYLTFNDLNLMLDGLRYGQRQVRWQDAVEVSPSRWGTRWIRLGLENQEDLFVRVPKDDREWLMQTIGQLILHHRDLHGIFPDNGVTPQPEPKETCLGQDVGHVFGQAPPQTHGDLP